MFIEARSQKPMPQGTPMMSRPGVLTNHEHVEFRKSLSPRPRKRKSSSSEKRHRREQEEKKNAFKLETDSKGVMHLVVPGLKEQMNRLEQLLPSITTKKILKEE